MRGDLRGQAPVSAAGAWSVSLREADRARASCSVIRGVSYGTAFDPTLGQPGDPLAVPLRGDPVAARSGVLRPLVGVALAHRTQPRAQPVHVVAGATAPVVARHVAHAEYTGHQLLLRCLPQLRDRFPDVTIVPEAMPTTAQLTRPHQINSGLCDRLLSAFHIGGADLRIIRTADSVHAIAAHVAAGTGIGITVESALDHQPPGLRIIPLTGPSTTADQVVLTPTEPSDTATALRDLLLQASAESPSTDH
ncbi:LysR substrate-binding domain-containing protein [Kitasatospora sp. NBC_00374]|uniref:LysR substrate-binding domain-containing protein n=1 Tax=Kitasatospora sp. NBC_00374 TaxID=2975964 RepID=UPI00324C24C2